MPNPDMRVASSVALIARRSPVASRLAGARRSKMKHCSIATLAVGIGLAAMPTLAPAQSPSAAAENAKRTIRQHRIRAPRAAGALPA